jgi:microcompartment protein CcmK/EutM
MYLGRITGRLVATTRYAGLEGVRFQWLQPLDEHGAPMGQQLVAAVALSVGPGDLVHFIDGREAALALPDETFVPIDVAVTGYVEQAAVGDTDLAER